MSDKTLHLAVMLSGSGTNLQAIVDAIGRGELDAVIEMVVASNPRARGILRAGAAALPTAIFQPADYDEPEELERKLVETFRRNGVDYVVLAGYMRKVTPVMLEAFPNRVINLHPALLPKFPGAHAIQEAYEAGETKTGITIHFANEEYDKGPIIFQHEVEVVDGEPIELLEQRIHEAEHRFYPKVLQKIAEDKVHVIDGVCTIDDR